MIFADTSYLYANLVSNDQRHADAVTLGQQSFGLSITTTSLVVGECWSLFNRRWGHEAALRFLQGIRGSQAIEICHVPDQLEEAAFRWLERHDEREYSFVDATSFAFMRHNKIHEALAFDGDFTAAGFVELRP